MRAWMDEAGVDLDTLRQGFTPEDFPGGRIPARSTIGDRLAGVSPTREFIEAVAYVCSEDEQTRAARVKAALDALIPRRDGAHEREDWHEHTDWRAALQSVLNENRGLRLQLDVLQHEMAELRVHLGEQSQHETGDSGSGRGEPPQEHPQSPEAEAEAGAEAEGEGEAESEVDRGPGERGGDADGRKETDERPGVPETAHLPVGPSIAIPVDFQAFYEMYHPAYMAYAELVYGDRHLAEEAVDAAWVTILGKWSSYLASERMESEVWAEVRRRVSPPSRVSGLDPVGAAMAAARERFSTFEESLGLYSAIADLPPRQFDVIVMKYVLGYSTSRTAGLLGVSEAMVRSQVHRAKRRLAGALNLPS
ncbi:sigma-70 family RNA polymerase sigma factor [Streptomyces sp. NPDC012935]|uniref:sigma-70 family RNA polymerase sigma factor n=1 Tax=Streptomyces sp. NPDC012935 TaxID=3364857 RepID=UPI0036CF568F